MRRDDGHGFGRRRGRVVGLFRFFGVVGVVLALFHGIATAQRVSIGFDAAGLADWQNRAFDGESRYRVVDRRGIPTLEAGCDGGASAIARRVPVDLTRTPVLHWQWRVDRAPAGGPDERRREGDDFAARVYVVRDGGLRPWRTRAVNYVWAREAAIGAHWPNPFTAKATMVVLRSDAGSDRGWVAQSRDVRADFERFHGLALDTIDAVAIMTDCDNAGGQARAAYRHLYFAPE